MNKKKKKSRNWASKNLNCDRTEYSLQTEAPGHDTISPSLQRMEAGAHISRPLIVTFLLWNQLFAPPPPATNRLKFLLVLPQTPKPHLLSSFLSLGSNSIHSCSDRRWLEPVKAKRFLGGGVGEDYVRIVEHVQAVQRERVDLQVVQRELGVDVEADVRREGAGELLGQAGGRLAAHWPQQEKEIKESFSGGRRAVCV